MKTKNYIVLVTFPTIGMMISSAEARVALVPMLFSSCLSIYFFYFFIFFKLTRSQASANIVSFAAVFWLRRRLRQMVPQLYSLNDSVSIKTILNW